MIYTTACLFYLVLFSYIIYKWRAFFYSGISVKYFIGVFFLKVFVGIFIWELYTKNLGKTDADVFFNDSNQLFKIAFESPVSFLKLFFDVYNEPQELYQYTSRMEFWAGDFNTVLLNDSRTMIRIHALIHFFSFGFFHVHTIFSAFLSLLGLNLVFRSLTVISKANKKLLFAAVFFVPSVLFWSSLILKESLIFLGIGLVLYSTEWGLKKEYSFKNGVGLLAGLFLMLIVKYYLLLAIFPALLSNILFTRFGQRKIVLIHTSVLFICFILFTQIPRVFPLLDPVKQLKDKQLNFNKMAKGGVFLYGNGNYIYVDYLRREEQLTYLTDTTCRLKADYFYKQFHQNHTDTTIVSGANDTTIYAVAFSTPPSNSRTDIIPVGEGTFGFFVSCLKANAKMFFLTGLLEQQNVYSYFAFAENSICLLLFLFLFRYRIREANSGPLMLTVLSFVLILHALIGITTPVWGSIVRYRMPALLFLMILFVVLFDSEKFKKKMKQGFPARKT